MAEQLLNEHLEVNLNHFYDEMNATSARLGLSGSNWCVSHGLANKDNYSTALDIAKLSRAALSRHKLLQEIVCTKTYSTQSWIDRSYLYTWKNTNKLLWVSDPDGIYLGVKTGVTGSAGPCLSV